MQVFDGQADFTGGMNNRVSPERLRDNEFALGKNVETRYGGIRSRRGSWRIYESLVDNNSDNLTVVGTGTFKSPNYGESDIVMNAFYRADDDQTLIYRTPFPVEDFRKAMPLPATMSGKQPITFVQAYDYVYALRDGNEPWRWNGDLDSNWEVVPQGTSGFMPMAREGRYAYNRMWLIEGNDTLIPSDLLSANWDRATNEIRVEQGDGTRLVALQEFGGGSLLAFKERGIALITSANNFSTANDLSLEFIDDRVGCVSPRTVVPIGKDVFFLGREGVWTIHQTSEQNAQMVELPLSEPIFGLIQEINWQHAENFSAVHYDNYYIVAVSVGGSEYPNRLLAYDLVSRSWVGYWEFGSTPQAFGRLAVIDHLSREYLLGQGANGEMDVLLRGDVKDQHETNKRVMTGGVTEVEVFFSGTAYPAGSDGFDFSEHTDGRVDMVVLFDPDTDPATINYICRGGTACGASRFLEIYFKHDDNYNLTTLYCSIYGGASKKWYGSITVDNVVDGKYHSLSLVQDGVEPWLELDGERHELTFDGALTNDKTAWIADCQSNLGFCYNSVTGAANEIKTGKLGYLSISTTYKTAGPHTTEIEEFIVPCTPGMDGKAWYVIDDVATEHTFPVDGRCYNAYLQVNASAEYTDRAGGSEDIESVVETRGLTFGDMLAEKGALRGEVRFAHGQPSLTAELLSDKVFDTETLSSLNAKTYSLTKYEVRGKADWSSDNSNDDFETPHREDYAPAPLGMDLGSGFPVDRYREHTELFSSLAAFGWVQLRLTNTQGYVRHNQIKMRAQARQMQQDRGNQ